MTPLEHFRNFVLPAVRDYYAAERDLTEAAVAERATTDAEALAMRRAAEAAKVTWHLADWMWENFSPAEQAATGAHGLAGYRKIIEQANCEYLRTGTPCQDFNLLGAVADAFKHYRIKNPLREIQSADAIGGLSTGFGEGRFGEGKFGGVAQVMIVQQDGSKRAFSAVVQNSVDMWRRVLGLPLPEISDFD
jgi:hypothetical protein